MFYSLGPLNFAAIGNLYCTAFKREATEFHEQIEF